MNDLISRQAVLMSLADYQLQESPNWGANGMGNTDAYEAITECIRVIEQAPTIDPVKHGEWVKDGETYALYKCSACNYFCTVAGYANCIPKERMYKTFKFCPNCGARME